MLNCNLLKSKMVACGLSISECLKIANISTDRYYRVIRKSKENNNICDFTIEEVENLAKTLNMTEHDVMCIFFASIVA